MYKYSLAGVLARRLMEEATSEIVDTLAESMGLPARRLRRIASGSKASMLEVRIIVSMAYSLGLADIIEEMIVNAVSELNSARDKLIELVAPTQDDYPPIVFVGT